MEHPATVIARDLAGQAERLCRHFLGNGRREGNYWLVGDIHNRAGRSLYVRLRASSDGTGAAGKWTDAQSGEHGDLLDIIRAATTGGSLSEALREARRFLSLPAEDDPSPRVAKAREASPYAASRLLAITRPIEGTPVQHYLAGRGIPLASATRVLRFHPNCWYRPSRSDRRGLPPGMPAMIAPVTDAMGRVTGAHRTWVMPDGSGKAMVASPRRAIGLLLGNGVRFGTHAEVMAAGEGIESILSLLTAIPALPAIAALSAAHLGALDFQPGLRRLYAARESDLAGRKAFARLSQRSKAQGVELRSIDSVHGDLNADLRAFGREELARRILAQMLPEDRDRFDETR